MKFGEKQASTAGYACESRHKGSTVGSSGGKKKFIHHYSEGNNSSAEPWFAMTKGITIAIANTNSDGIYRNTSFKRHRPYK